MKRTFKETIKNGCTIFTIITVISYTLGMLISSADKAYIPTLKSIYIYLIFSVLFAFANNLLSNKKIITAVRLAVHFFVSAALFFVVMILGGGLSVNGFATIIMMSAFVVLYLIFAVVYIVCNRRKDRKENAEKNYSSLFN